MACSRDFQFVVKVSDTAAARNGFVEYRTSGHFFHVLAEIADGQLLRDGEFAVVGLLPRP